MFAMPQPTPEHQKMALLSGDWSGEEVMPPQPWMPAGAKGTGHITGRMVLGGFHLISECRSERDGKTVYEGHGVMCYDKKAGRYVQHWFDSMGSHADSPPARGNWHGDSLVLESSGMCPGPDGKETMMHSRYTYKAKGKDFTLVIESSPDGKSWKTFMTGTYRKK